jgi:Ca-activated chloride channel family protein
LCTDGDFNVGTTSPDQLVSLVEKEAKTGVFLSVLGFGRGNLNDAMMEDISNRGNGNYAYIDSQREAEKVLVQQTGGTLITIAKDVKIQIEFNPAEVGAYRLIGYENRMLKKEDFKDDSKDAGEIGAGHTVTALYEIIPADAAATLASANVPQVDDLEFQQARKLSEAAGSGQLLTLKLRYKQPDADKSQELKFPVNDKGESFGGASEDFQFAAAVAGFGMLLRDSEHKGDLTYDAILEIAGASKGDDPHGYRAEMLEMVKRAKQIAER